MAHYAVVEERISSTFQPLMGSRHTDSVTAPPKPQMSLKKAHHMQAACLEKEGNHFLILFISSAAALKTSSMREDLIEEWWELQVCAPLRADLFLLVCVQA